LKQLLFISIILILLSCKSSHIPKSGFDLQQESYSSDTVSDKIYIVDTKPIDSIDVNKMIYDIFRVDYSMYPDSIKLYARPYDSLGNFVTQMAYPYKTSEITYFTQLDERLGKVYNVRDTNIKEFNVREYGIGDSMALSIVLTLDYSGSVSQMMDIIIEGTEIFVSLKYPFDQICINSFNDKFDTKVPFDTNMSKIIKTFKSKARNNMGLFSAFYDAAYKSVQLFEETDSTTPRILVLFSDGDDNYSKVKYGEIIELAQKLNVNIFTIAFGYSIDENLEYLSKYTGGKSYKAYTKEELIAIFRDIYNSLRNYYLISYKPPKYWGLHKVFSTLYLPGRSEDLIAEGEYNTSDITPWSDLSDIFERPIVFEFDKSDILPESNQILDEITDAMMTIPRLRLEIQGHTDNMGSQEYNLNLSNRRAQAVFNGLIERGIEERRLRYRGFGMNRPKVPNDTEENRAKNRRTEFVIIAK
jgi:outer membrane protein OmpA-like peptidoglycan-associated protein